MVIPAVPFSSKVLSQQSPLPMAGKVKKRMKEMEEPVRFLLQFLADSVSYVHSGRSPFCSRHGSPQGCVCVRTPHRLKEKETMRMKRKMAELGLLASLLTALVAVKGTWAAQRSWGGAERWEGRSAVWRGRSG